MLGGFLLLAGVMWSLARSIAYVRNDQDQLLTEVCLLIGVDRQQLRDAVRAPPPAQQGPGTNPIRAVTTDTNPAAAVVAEQQPVEEWRGRFAFTAGSGSTASRHHRRR